MGFSYSPDFCGYAFDIYCSTILEIKWRQEEFPGFARIGLGTSVKQIEGTDAPRLTPELNAAEFTTASAGLENDVQRF